MPLLLAAIDLSHLHPHHPLNRCRWFIDLRDQEGRGSIRYDSLLKMKDSSKMESVVVGIFDNSQDLDRADKGLAAAGFESAVYDEAVGAEESCEVDPVAVGSVLAPTAVSTDGSAGGESDLPGMGAFRSHLADHGLPNEVIDAYATAFSHEGRFLVVRTEPECVKYIVPILRDCGASRVDEHDADALV